jgi:Asp-tRNA(Asn)/Glu-tRNA(Gln) amidotransferase A subunit family amidase
MVDSPWQGDACSLVDAFRAGERSPVEELEASVAAIEASDLNCFSFLDIDRAREAARSADTSLPFGGVPAGIKELEPVQGWPYTEASLVFADRVADHTSTMVERLTGRGGAVPVGLTTASEFGGLNVSVSKLNGITHNPWREGRTVGGSSGGSAAAVAGGLVSLATGGDGGGSIRIPAGYTGLVGMKGTYGRIPCGPHARIGLNTVVLGCLARSVRDAARYYDVCAGYDPGDPKSLPDTGGWEAGLGTHALVGLKVIVDPTLGGASIAPGVESLIRDAAEALIRDAKLEQVTGHIKLPNLAAQWMMGNLAGLLADLEGKWPRCRAQLTDELAVALYLSQSLYNLRIAAAAEQNRTLADDALAEAFEQADLIICATNPDVAFPAEASMSASGDNFVEWARTNEVARWGFRRVMGLARVGTGLWPALPAGLIEWAMKRFPDVFEMGAQTMVSNLCGNPAVSIPIGAVDGLPVGMQVLARHHADALLLDVALHAERERPWPVVAPARLSTTSSFPAPR